MHVLKKLGIILAALALLAGVSACEGDKGSGQDSTEAEQQRKGETYDQLVSGQPAGSMSFSPTRETINFWIGTWDKPNKLSYVYLVNSEGTALGYYILQGLPVSYCASLTPTYTWVDIPGDENDLKEQAPAPAMDGVYYSGGQCNSYYGKDATTGAYVEYTAGLGINVLLYDSPLPAFNGATALGPTTVDEAQQQ